MPKLHASILIVPVPFCYGPAAHTLAIAEALRRFPGGAGLTINAVARGVISELLSTSPALDTVYIVPESEPFPATIQHAVRSSDYVMCIGDFEFLRVATEIRRDIDFLDPLFWMWPQPPKEIIKCRQLFVVDFDGANERIEATLRTGVLSKAPILVEQIVSPTLTESQNQRPRTNVLVNFGGMKGFWGMNVTLVNAMAEEIIAAWNSFAWTDSRLLIRGGAEGLSSVGQNLEGATVTVGAVSQRVFFEELLNASLIFSVPGMSVVFEAIEAQTPMAFLLPLNYSQHVQLAAYRRSGAIEELLSFEEIQGCHTLTLGHVESEAIKECNRMGQDFAENAFLRSRFRARVRSALARGRQGSLAPVDGGAMPMFMHNHGGAKQIAGFIVNRVGM